VLFCVDDLVACGQDSIDILASQLMHSDWLSTWSERRKCLAACRAIIYQISLLHIILECTHLRRLQEMETDVFVDLRQGAAMAGH